MSEPTRTLNQQLQARLDSLRAAGIEFLPRLTTLPTAAEIAAAQSLSAPPTDESPDESPSDPGNEVRVALKVLATEISRCNKCPELFSTRTQTVFGVGPDQPDLCFIGEAPGADEDRQGEPFVGRAGQLLNKIISAMGLQREEVYIMNTLKCRPPNNAVPTQNQLNNCRSFFDRQLEILKPKFLCCLGGVAAKHVLNTNTGIMQLRGKLMKYKEIPLVCTYHPSYLLRQEGEAQRKAKAECWDDMKTILKLMGREIPGAK